MSPPRLGEVAAYVDGYLRVREHREQGNGLLAGSPAMRVGRIGVALEPEPTLPAWFRRRSLDALILHRAWGLVPGMLPPGAGVLAYHLPLDEHLTLGFNPLLADALGLAEREPLGTRQGRVVGMLGHAGPAEFGVLEHRVRRELGGLEAVVPPRDPVVRRVAVMGAMTDALVREAAARGADVYLTGQLRAPARDALRQTGIGAIATGHRRSEHWGLRALAGLLRQRWPALEVVVQEDSSPEVAAC